MFTTALASGVARGNRYRPVKILIQTWEVESAGVDVTRWDVVAGSLTLMVFTTRSRGQACYDNNEPR